MTHLKLSDLIDRPVPLSSEEAVALTLGVATAVTAGDRTALPPDERILLSSTGQVSLDAVHDVDSEDTTTEPLTAQLAALTRRLLQLDRPGAVDRRRRVPAQLLVILARAMGQVDPPPPALDELRAALARFGAPEPTMLAAVFWRAARLCAPSRAPLVVLPPVKVESALAPRDGDDRRHSLPPPSELRRYLRETERELFEARSRPAHGRPAAFVGSLPIITPPPPRQRFYNTRLWRVSSGVAATVVGAVLGTVMAFMLAGSAERAPEQTGSGEPQAVSTLGIAPAAHPAEAPPHPAQSTSGAAERPIRTERTVQPLLLAAAVGADVFSPSFGPRGRALFFHAGRESAPLMRASVSDSGEVEVNRIETVLNDGASNYHVTIAPDETRIAYDSDRDGVRGVYVANADGSNPHRISGHGYAAVPSWSPDGERVAFIRAEPGHSRVWNVWYAELHSGHLRRVTSHTVGQPWGASWFPDGRRLAYSVEDRLMLADLESGLARGFRSPRPGRLVRTPAVSPNGRQIVFQVQRDGVWLLDLEKARMRRILADASAEEFVWSPDGGTIAYHARKAGSYGLWRLAVQPSGN